MDNSLIEIARSTESPHIRAFDEPAGLAGRSAAETEEYGGGRFTRLGSRDEAALRVLDSKDPAAEIMVVEHYAGPDERGIGAHAYVIAWRGGRIMEFDPRTKAWKAYEWGSTRPGVVRLSAMVFDANGVPERSPSDPDALPAYNIGSDQGRARVELQVAQPNRGDAYQPAIAAQVPYRVLRVENGIVYGPDGQPYNTGSDGEYFLIGKDPADIRSVDVGELNELVQVNAPHQALYSTYADPADGPAGFGAWIIRDGRLQELIPFSTTFSNRYNQAQITTQLRDILAANQIDVTQVKMDGVLMGRVWRAEASPPDPGTVMDAPEWYAHIVFNSSGPSSWIDVTRSSSVDDTVS
ncbi:hypothetical protein, partial [Streptomyces roseolus]|uniref:hypothetical protein n=1 Tax=Streptomyces roseolus TaxID=67358 RepID=UPI0036612712